MSSERQYVLGGVALAWAGRCVWLICIGVYLTVFVGGILAGGDELLTMGRAVALTLRNIGGDIPGGHLIVLGAILIAASLFLKRGIVGAVLAALRRRRERTP